VRKLIFIIILLFSTSVFAAKYYSPCLKSSDLTYTFGPPQYQSGYNFFWFTKYFTAICEVEIDSEDYCFINKTTEELKGLNGKKIYSIITGRPENSCQ